MHMKYCFSLPYFIGIYHYSQFEQTSRAAVIVVFWNFNIMDKIGESLTFKFECLRNCYDSHFTVLMDKKLT